MNALKSATYLRQLLINLINLVRHPAFRIRSHGQQLLQVYGTDKLVTTVEEPIAANLVDTLSGVERVPEHGLGSVRAEVADGAAGAVDAVVFAHAAARRSHGVREPVFHRVVDDGPDRGVSVRENEQRVRKLRLELFQQGLQGRVEADGVCVHLRDAMAVWALGHEH